MKNLKLAFLMFLLPFFAVAQSGEKTNLPKNSILVTPLGDLLNNSKSSLYYRRLLRTDSINKYVSLRVGTELFNTINNNFSSGRNTKAGTWNIKAGLEMGRNLGRMVIYFGPEISYTASRINDATLFPNENALFSTHSIEADEWSDIDEGKLSIFAFIGFFGFKYKVIPSLSVGIESAIGVGWYNSEATYSGSSSSGEQHDGVIRGLSACRFILVEYSF